jgi:hypothetical protein
MKICPWGLNSKTSRNLSKVATGYPKVPKFQNSEYAGHQYSAFYVLCDILSVKNMFRAKKKSQIFWSEKKPSVMRSLKGISPDTNTNSDSEWENENLFKRISS